MRNDDQGTHILNVVTHSSDVSLLCEAFDTLLFTNSDGIILPLLSGIACFNSFLEVSFTSVLPTLDVRRHVLGGKASQFRFPSFFLRRGNAISKIICSAKQKASLWPCLCVFRCRLYFLSYNMSATTRMSLCSSQSDRFIFVLQVLGAPTIKWQVLKISRHVKVHFLLFFGEVTEKKVRNFHFEISFEYPIKL